MSERVSQGGESSQASGATRTAFRLAAESLSHVGKHWPHVLRRTEDVTQFLHDFYASWVSSNVSRLNLADVVQDQAERMARFAGAGGLDEAAHSLHAEIEEAAVPFANVDWLLVFLSVVEGLHDRLIRYAAALCRAQAEVIDRCVLEALFTDSVPDPYELAIDEFQELYSSEEISHVELD